VTNSLRIVDQETARVVAIRRQDGNIVGAGCLINKRYILTCLHVVESATEGAENKDEVNVSLIGVNESATIKATIKKRGKIDPQEPQNDLALLEIRSDLNIQDAEFASPLRHGGKQFSVLGFPGGDVQGKNVRGVLFAADAKGLVQMDRAGAVPVRGGFSGAPVWCPDLSAFVGIVVSELSGLDLSWCIPSRRLAEFFPKLPVRFRIPASDRPIVHDPWEDDPNIDLFGTVSENGKRRLTAIVRKNTSKYTVDLLYECLSRDSRGRYVTFITYPNFKDAYELFAKIENDKATQTFWPRDLFTVAAIGDGGDTALTLDLTTVPLSRTKPRTKS